jgi:uncharacterized protein (DUF983 family)
MSASFTPVFVGGQCPHCHVGQLYQFTEDPQGVLRCSPCGELEKKATPEVEEVPQPRTITRRKTA